MILHNALLPARLYPSSTIIKYSPFRFLEHTIIKMSVNHRRVSEDIQHKAHKYGTMVCSSYRLQRLFLMAEFIS